jgi:hypothetical protein
MERRLRHFTICPPAAAPVANQEMNLNIENSISRPKTGTLKLVLRSYNLPEWLADSETFVLSGEKA